MIILFWTKYTHQKNKPVCLTGERKRSIVKGKPSRATTAALKNIVDLITRSADPDRIILFGSRSKGTQTSKSDYDICVIKHGVKHRRELAMKLYRDLYGVGVPVDIIVETPETFEELSSNPFMIYHDIARQGRLLYEKPVPC